MKYIFVISAIVLSALSGFPAAAEAQIYSWRDENGILTISNRPRGAEAQGVTVPVGSLPAVARLNPQYEPLIRQHATLQGVRPDLVRAVIQVESAFNPRAVSPKGAMGLMQLMPATAKEFGVVDPFNPAENIRAGVHYLRRLLDRYNDDEQLALAAYNAGPGAVEKYGNTVPPYKETRNYVEKIAGIRGNLRHGPEAITYKVTELVDGRTVVTYTNVRPSKGAYEIVSRK